MNEVMFFFLASVPSAYTEVFCRGEFPISSFRKISQVITDGYPVNSLFSLNAEKMSARCTGHGLRRRPQADGLADSFPNEPPPTTGNRLLSWFPYLAIAYPFGYKILVRVCDTSMSATESLDCSTSRQPRRLSRSC